MCDRFPLISKIKRVNCSCKERFPQAICNHKDYVHKVKVIDKEYYLGQTKVLIRTHELKGVGFIYLNLHSNETTSVEAAKKVLTKGKIITLEHKEKERNVSFTLDNKKFLFDPNRIFSDLGIKNTLENLSEYNQKVHKVVFSLSKNIIVYLKNGQIIVALHNNKADGNYSIESYLEGGEESHATADIHISKSRHKDDFFLVTNNELFQYFKKRNFNVVLQDNIKVLEDGSLSVYCGKNNIPYINIEAQHGHLNDQMKMLEMVQKIDFI